MISDKIVLKIGMMRGCIKYKYGTSVVERFLNNNNNNIFASIQLLLY